MNGKDAIQKALASTQHMLTWYLSDLSDADLLVRPVPNANHIAWQLGHLIASEADMVRPHLNADFPDLPPGFKEQHGKETAAVDPPKGFKTKQEYLDLYNKGRGATLAAVAKLRDADLDKPMSGPMAEWAPTLGALLLLLGNHDLMHAGQFTVVRRKLNKPVLF